MYIWQYPNWTDFTYQDPAVTPLLQRVLANQQQLKGQAAQLPDDLDR
jgi:hypothetical protein